jgi:hypothetical protein
MDRRLILRGAVLLAAGIALALTVAGIVIRRAEAGRGTVARWILDRVRQFNKRILNPVILRRVESSHSDYPSMVHHVGRCSGHPYATPVAAEPISSGFVIPLPYGIEVDWCRNVLAAGTCTIERSGVTWMAGEPELVEAPAVLAELRPLSRLIYRLVGIKHFLSLRTFVPAPMNDSAA